MTGVELIAVERKRQIDVEGWTPEHDDAHESSEMSGAAIAYAGMANRVIRYANDMSDEELSRVVEWVPNDWPLQWSTDWWKPSLHPIRNLVKAGALIAAEIDRLQRKGGGQ